MMESNGRLRSLRALDMAIQCRPFDGECLRDLYDAILEPMDEIDEVPEPMPK